MHCLVFSKVFKDQSVPAMAKTVKAMGFNGVDLTVRGGGHVDTDVPDVAQRLREAVGAIRDTGLSMPLATTNITTVDDAAVELFEACAEMEIPFIKLGYPRWSGMGRYGEDVDRTRRDLDGLEELAVRTGVCATLHNHSGSNFLYANPLTVYELIRDRDPAAIGWYMDAGHTVAEGMAGAWRHAIDFMGDRIALVGCKSYGFEPNREGGTMQPTWKRTARSLVEGAVPWQELLSMLSQTGFDGPVTFHAEYPLAGEALLRQVEADLQFFRSVAQAAS